MAYRIHIFNDTERNRLPVKVVKDDINCVLKDHNIESAEIRVIYTGAERMTEINEEYLQHKGATDVITFDLGDDDIDGEIYVCADVAEENSKLYNSSFKEELIRYAVHGALHLVGYDDDTDEKRNNMHNLENKYIGVK